MIRSAKLIGLIALAITGLGMNATNVLAVDGQIQIYHTYTDGSPITSGPVTVTLHNTGGSTPLPILTHNNFVSGTVIIVPNPATNRIVQVTVAHSAGGSVVIGNLKGNSPDLQVVNAAVPPVGYVSEVIYCEPTICSEPAIYCEPAPPVRCSGCFLRGRFRCR